MPRRPCIECGALSGVGRPRCRKCTAEWERKRGSPTARGYGPQWEGVKALARLNIPMVCANCGDLGDLTLDHIVPISKGGTARLDNVQWLCRSCNSAKGSKV